MRSGHDGRDIFATRSRSRVFHLARGNPPICYNPSTNMVRGIEGNEMSTPRSSLKKQPASASRSAKNQKSILGFFQKQPSKPSAHSPTSTLSDTTLAKEASTLKLSKNPSANNLPSLTPQPSSDPVHPSSPIRQNGATSLGRNKENGTNMPKFSSYVATDCALPEVAGVASTSPSRKVPSAPRTADAMLT